MPSSFSELKPAAPASGVVVTHQTTEPAERFARLCAADPMQLTHLEVIELGYRCAAANPAPQSLAPFVRAAEHALSNVRHACRVLPEAEGSPVPPDGPAFDPESFKARPFEPTPGKAPADGSAAENVGKLELPEWDGI